jgi:hypothetical protein
LPHLRAWFGALGVVVLLEGAGDLTSLLERGWPVDFQAVAVVGAVLALDERVQVGTMGWIAMRDHAQAGQKPDQWRGKSLVPRRTDKAWVACVPQLGVTGLPSANVQPHTSKVPRSRSSMLLIGMSQP